MEVVTLGEELFFFQLVVKLERIATPWYNTYRCAPIV
jgi:hypothetical protein